MDLNKKIEQLRRQAEQSDLLKTASASAKKVADEAKKQAVRAVESDTFKDAAGKARSVAGQLGTRLVQLSESANEKVADQKTHHTLPVSDVSSRSKNNSEHAQKSPKPAKTPQTSHKSAMAKSKSRQQKIGFAILIGLAVVALIIALAGSLLTSDDSSSNSATPTTNTSTSIDSSTDNKVTPPKAEVEPELPAVDTTELKGSLAKTVADKLLPKGYEVKAVEEETGLDVTANINNEDRWVLDATQDGKTITLTVKQLPKTLTQDDQELAALLAVRDPLDPSVEQFAQNHAGDYIEFDGNVAAASPDGTTLVHAGNYDPNSAVGPEFQFTRVPLADSGPLSVGMNVHIKAEVGYFDSTQGLFKLEYDSITPR
jgi:hypothetical protein